MSMTFEQLSIEVMKLGAKERGALAGQLIHSISREEADASDAEIIAEAERREAEYRKDTSRAKPVDEVIDRLLKKAAG